MVKYVAGYICGCDVAGVAVWGWWLENGPDKSGSEEGEKEEQEEKKN